MAEQVVSDLIMKFVGDEGAITGESRTTLNAKPSKMKMGFKEDKMFEIESFTFKTGLGGEDLDEMAEKTKNDQDKQTTQINKRLQKVALHTGLDLASLKKASGQGFSKFRAGENATYPVDIKPFEFTRAIDVASATLMQYCIKRKVFKSASLIKRKAAGGAASGEIFLRFDFNTVLVNNIDWDNEDPIKETVEFVCRAVTIHYLPQLPNGTLGAAKQAFWSASPNVTATILTLG